MGIKVSTFTTQPALAFDQVHLCELRIMQPEEQVSKFDLRIAYKMFGVDAGGIKHFERGLRSSTIADFEQLATVKAGEGDMALANAHTAIQSALAAIIANGGEHGSTQVV